MRTAGTRGLITIAKRVSWDIGVTRRALIASLPADLIGLIAQKRTDIVTIGDIPSMHVTTTIVATAISGGLHTTAAARNMLSTGIRALIATAGMVAAGIRKSIGDRVNSPHDMMMGVDTIAEQDRILVAAISGEGPAPRGSRRHAMVTIARVLP